MDRSLPMRGTKTPPPSPTHHLRILPILPRSARRYHAFLVDRIDVPDKFAIAPLQSHTAEIRRSDLPGDSPWGSSVSLTLVAVANGGTDGDCRHVVRLRTAARPFGGGGHGRNNSDRDQSS